MAEEEEMGFAELEGEREGTQRSPSRSPSPPRSPQRSPARGPVRRPGAVRPTSVPGAAQERMIAARRSPLRGPARPAARPAAARPRAASPKKPRARREYGPQDKGKVSVLRIARARCHTRSEEGGNKFSAGVDEDCVWKEVGNLLRQINDDWTEDQIADEVDRLRSGERGKRKVAPEQLRLRRAAIARIRSRLGREDMQPGEKGRIAFYKGPVTEEEIEDEIDAMGGESYFDEHPTREKGQKVEVVRMVSVKKAAAGIARQELGGGKFEKLPAEGTTARDEYERRKAQIEQELISGTRVLSPRKSSGRRSPAPRGSPRRTATRPTSPRSTRPARRY